MTIEETATVKRVKELVAAALELTGAGREALVAGGGVRDVSAVAGEDAGSDWAVSDCARVGAGRDGCRVFGRANGGDLEQAVAIKPIKRGMDTGAILGRFREERRLQARLNHPNIVRLIDGGMTESGLPYFVMEFVKGTPLDVYAAALPRRAKLGLFLTVCGAVEFAQRNLILHRDLKAANVLVDEEGHPKLLDFGIAKALDSDTGFTQEGWRALTPEVASPEQMMGAPLTTASDVYSLGKLLGKLEGPVADDLRLILSKATAEAAEERYPAAAELKADLERYLAGEPVRAERRFREVRQMANGLLFELHDAIAPLEGSTAARALVVGKAIRYLDQLASEAQDDAELQRELAQSYLKLGRVQGSYFEANLGQVGDAHASFAKAELAQALLRLATTENAANRPAEALRLCDRAIGLLWMPHPRAQFARGMANFGKAEGYLRMSKAAESKAARGEAIRIFRGLVAKDPKNKDALRLLANSYRRLATSEAVARALEADEKLAALSPNDGAAKLGVASDDSYLGALAMREKQIGRAAGELKLALTVLREHCAADRAGIGAHGPVEGVAGRG